MTLALGCVAALIAVAGLSLFAGGRPPGSRLVYGACLAVSLVALGAMLAQMQAAPERLALPLGLPWIGANFRLDPLAAAFLAVVNLGGAAASLYALGHGEHEPAPMRVLPFFPAFLAGMNLVVLADDAFTFLFAWEFMSLTSWALVMAHHEKPENLRAGYVYLVMASFGTLVSPSRLRAPCRTGRGLRLRRHRGRTAGAAARRADPGACSPRRRIEGRPRAAARLAAARAPGGAEPRLGADERRYDQGRDLRLRADRVRPPRRAGMVVGHGRARHRRRYGAASACSMP